MIHQYKSNGYNIVMDVNSGAVHVVDDVTYDAIELFEDISSSEIVDKLKDKYNESDILEAIDEIEELKKDGQLFTEDIYQPFVEKFKENRQTVVKALCLHIAHDCNLACKYCFAEEGEYHGRRELMSFEVGKKALDFLVKNSGNRVNLEVDFFGGEPLMNWEVVKQLVEYGRSLEKPYNKKFRFTLTTNGVLLNDEIMEYLNKEMSNVVISLDGRKEVNDRMRPFRNGKGSYDLIVPKFKKLAESRNQTNYYIRGTFTRDNLDFSEDVKIKLREKALKMVYEVYLAELEYSKLLYKNLGLLDEVKTYLEFNVNYALSCIDFEPMFNVTENDVNSVVMNGYSTETKTHDFFSTKGNGYIKTTKVEDLTDEDFEFNF